MKFTKTVFLVPLQRTCGRLITVFFLSPFFPLILLSFLFYGMKMQDSLKERLTLLINYLLSQLSKKKILSGMTIFIDKIECTGLFCKKMKIDILFYFIF